jgi:signal transduction histidine kinase
MLTDEGTCIGLLVAMDTDPHEFSPEAIAFMELLARWSVSEYERHCLTEALKTASLATSASSTDSLQGTLLDTLRFTLMSQLTQDMRNPLTTINGMSNMLSREIYGTLSPKQREYADIIHNSSRHLLEVAHEVLELGSLDTGVYSIHPTAVDVEMIGQQVQRLLLPITSKNNQYISVTVEPGSRLWILDREVLRHCLYYLVYCMVNLSGEGGTIRIHGTERDHSLHLGVWLVHPWLGEGLPSAVANLFQQINDPMKERTVLVALLAKAIGRPEAIATPEATTGFERTQESFLTKSRETLSFLLSRHLVEQYGGTMMMQGNVDTGYRLTITLPFKKSVVGEGTMD